MGRQWIEGLQEVYPIKQCLEIHLTGNHYPPVSLDFVPSCMKAIKHCNEGNYDKKIKMPNGKVRSAYFIVEGLHLETFLEERDVDYGY